MANKSSAYGVDMDQLKHNFKQYQYKGFDIGTGTSNSGMAPSAAGAYKSDYQANLKKYLTTPSYTTNNTVNQTNNQTDNRSVSSNTVDNDILQNAGNKEDWTTTIGNQNSISNSNIGNDYSVNIGGIGNGGGAGNSSGLNNMQSAAAYTALNNNQFKRSQSELNGRTRAQQAISDGNAATGAYDRAANLYNSVGYDQNYWRAKSDAQQNFYLGDIFKMQAPEYLGGGVNPSDPMKGDKTEEIYNDFKDSIKS